MDVVYFGCWAHPKAGWNTFFSRFQPFFFISNLFQWFQVWNEQKTSENEQNNLFTHISYLEKTYTTTVQEPSMYVFY